MKNSKTSARVTVIRGGRLLDAGRRRADAADLLIEGDTIRAVGPARMKAPAGATVVDARGMLLHPGLVNAHTHGHGNLGKGMGDRWTLELLLTASPWLAGHRTTQDKYLGTLIGAAEMALKGCTACYDLSFEFPTPSVDGMNAAAQAYRDVGIRAVVAPMVADHSFTEDGRHLLIAREIALVAFEQGADDVGIRGTHLRAPLDEELRDPHCG